MTIVEKIKAELKKTLGMVEESFSDEIRISEKAIGAKAEVVNEDGSLSPAPDGTYKIGEDEIKVKDGVVAAINGDENFSAETSTEETPTEEAPTELPIEEEEVVVPNPEIEAFKSEMGSFKTEMETLQTSFAELKAAIDEMKTQLADEAKKEAAFATQLQELNETMKKLVVTPAQFTRTNHSIKEKDSKEKKMSELMKVFAAKNQEK